jgi:hypothetical protein
MDPQYDVCFAGEILQGQDLDSVKLKLATLFRADEATVLKLFSGKSQYVKRNCDRATALKYKKAMEQAGAKPLIRAASSADLAAPDQSAPGQHTATPTAAERIAAIASGADTTEPTGASAASTTKENNDSGEDFDLAPTGADVLRPEERAVPVDSHIDTSGIEVMDTGVSLANEALAAPAAPDTTHLSMGEVGEDIPTLPSSTQALSPDISGIALSPQDSDFSDCATPPPSAPQLDLSALDLAPSGADLLEPGYRKKHDAQAPATDHLELE